MSQHKNIHIKHLKILVMLQIKSRNHPPCYFSSSFPKTEKNKGPKEKCVCPAKQQREKRKKGGGGGDLTGTPLFLLIVKKYKVNSKVSQ